MKYWLFHNNQVAGPYAAEALAGLSGFSAESLVCPEGRRGTQMGDWQRAGVVAELSEVLLRPARVPTALGGGPAAVGAYPGGSRLPPEPTLRDLAALGSLQERVQQLETSLQGVQSDLREREEEISSLKSALEEKTREASGVREQLEALEGRLSETESLRGQLSKAQEDEAERSRALESLRGELETVRASLESIRSGYAAQSAALEDSPAPAAFEPGPAGGPAPLPDLGGALEPLPSLGEPEPLQTAEPSPAPGPTTPPDASPSPAQAFGEIEIPDVAPAAQQEGPVGQAGSGTAPADVSIGEAHPTESGAAADPLDLGIGPAQAADGPEADPSPLFAGPEQAPGASAPTDPLQAPVSFPQPGDIAPQLEPMSPPAIEERPAALGGGIDPAALGPGASQPFQPPPLEPLAPGPGESAEIPNTLVGEQGAPPPADFSALGMSTPAPVPVGAQTAPVQEGLVDLTQEYRKRKGRGKGFFFLLLLLLTGGGAAGAVYLGYLDLEALKSRLPPELAAKISEVVRAASQAAGTQTPQPPAQAPEAPPDRSEEALRFAKDYRVSGKTLALLLDPSPAPGISPWTVQPLEEGRYEVDFFPRTGGGSPPYRFEVDLERGNLRGLDEESRRVLSGKAAPKTPAPASSLLGGGLGEEAISGRPRRAAPKRKPRQRRAAKPPAALGGLLEQDGPDLDLPGLGKAKAGGKEEELSLDQLLLPGIPKKRQ